MGRGGTIPAKIAVERELKDLPVLVVFVGILILNYVWGSHAVERSPITRLAKELREHGVDEEAEALSPAFDTGLLVEACMIAVGVAVAWLLLLIKFPRFTVWSILLISHVLGLVAGYYLYMDVHEYVGGPLAATSAISLLLLYAIRERVDRAAELMKISVACFIRYPSLIVVNLGLNILMAVAVGQQVIFIMHMASISVIGGRSSREEDCHWQRGCEVVYSKNDMHMRRVLFVLAMHWWVGFFKATRLFVTAFTTGVWWFHNGRTPLKVGGKLIKPPTLDDCKTDCGATAVKYVATDPVARGLLAGVKYHLGTIAFAGGLMALCTWLQKKARKYSKSCNPIKRIIGCLLECILQYLKVMTKFSLIGAAFSGKGLWSAGGAASRTMGGTFAGAFVHDVVSSQVLFKGAHYISFAVALIFVESAPGVNLEDFIPQTTVEAINTLLLLGLVLWILKKPIFCVLVAVLLLMVGVDEENFFIALLLYGGTCHIVLKFIAESILDITDSLFLAYAAGPRGSGSPSPLVSVFRQHVGVVAGKGALTDGSLRDLEEGDTSDDDSSDDGNDDNGYSPRVKINMQDLTALPQYNESDASTLMGAPVPTTIPVVANKAQVVPLQAMQAPVVPLVSTGAAKQGSTMMPVWSPGANGGQGGWVQMAVPSATLAATVSQLAQPMTQQTLPPATVSDAPPAYDTVQSPTADVTAVGVAKYSEPTESYHERYAEYEEGYEQHDALGEAAGVDDTPVAETANKHDDAASVHSERSERASKANLEVMISAAMAAGKSPAEIGQMVQSFTAAASP